MSMTNYVLELPRIFPLAPRPSTLRSLLRPCPDLLCVSFLFIQASAIGSAAMDASSLVDGG